MSEAPQATSLTGLHIITAPTVTPVAIPTFLGHPRYEVPKDGTESERLIAHAGKGCYDSYGADGRSCSQHIRTLIDSGHGSVLEHANISLFIEGISRGCSHEIVRHRAGFAYSQRSTRYVDEAEAAIVLEPELARIYEAIHFPNPKTGAVATQEREVLQDFLHACAIAQDAYLAQVTAWLRLAPAGLSTRDRRKWARGKARQVLPHAIETRMTMTGNLRAWRHFIEQRSAPGAEAEIRRLAMHVLSALRGLAPEVFGDYQVNAAGLLTTSNRKV